MRTETGPFRLRPLGFILAAVAVTVLACLAAHVSARRAVLDPPSTHTGELPRR